MKPLDLHTLIYIFAAISLLFAVLMFLFYKMAPVIKGPLLWSIAGISAVVSAFLFVSYPLFNGYITFVVSGGFSILTVGLYWAGIREFKGLSVDYRIVGVLVILQLFLTTLFYLVIPMPNIRMIIFSGISIISYLLVIRELVKPIEKPYRLGFLLCVIVFVISTITSTYRIINIVYVRPGLPHAPTHANLAFYFFMNITQALLLFSFLLLIGTKISEGIKKKVEDQRKFYSIISHDLSGPVGMINVMLNMVNHDFEIDQKERRQIALEAEKLSISTYHLLQNLLVWSKSQLEDLRPKPQLFDLDKIIRDNIEFMRQIASSKDISIIYDQNLELHCFADSRMIETVIRNLISNAVKFTNQGGNIQIMCEIDEKSIGIIITDNGIGMSEDLLKNLFSLNEKESRSGTSGERGAGLGLKICKDFVELNKGTLQIKSSKNEGTEVTVTLPVR